MKKIPIIIIGGPTASGKTAVSLELAKLVDAEIISADSRQVYKHLDIGTAKPTAEELAVATHHFIDTHNPDEYFSAGRFGQEAYTVAQEIHQKGKLPIVVGGSGFYIKALCEGMFDEENSNNPKRMAIQKKYEQLLETEGREYLHQQLLTVDKKAAEQYVDKNPRRLIRALEYFELHGSPFSEADIVLPERNLQPYYFGVQWERQKLYDRINLRTEIMWETGLIEETQQVLKMGYSPEINSLNTVGYKECIAYLNGDWDKKVAIEEMQKNTRHYAKRQLTWFRQYETMQYLTGDAKSIAARILVEIA